MYTEITPQEIKEIRGKYGLSQKSFAQLLGIGPASMVRYEQGSKPSKANANLIRAARHPEFMLECLKRDGDLLPKAQRSKAQRVIYACISLDAIGEEQDDLGEETMTNEASASHRPTMDEVYHFTLQKEVLNEQAANILSEIIGIKISSGFSGSAGDVFELLFDQVATVKPRIIERESENDTALASIRGYLKCANDLLDRQKLGAA